MDLRSAAARSATVTALAERSQSRKQEAMVQARQMGWAVRGTTPDGRTFELMELNEFGQPMYYITMNVQAAISTAADQVRNTAPYNLSGTNLIAGVWDGGAVRPDHQEFVSPNRVVVQDGAGNNWHATHVGGTIGAKGAWASALGMAPSVIIHSYDWDDDLAEMTAAAATGPDQSTNIYISNHSYGYLTGWENGNWSGNSGWHWFGVLLSDREARGFGQYSIHARNWDDLCYNAPYFLPFKAAGNDRNDGMPNTGGTFYYRDINDDWKWTFKNYDPDNDPFADQHKQGGYNTISYNGVAKNIMTVGAVSNAVSGGERDPEAASMSAFSGWGPADDGRIKPDIVANGVGLTSPIASTTSSYGTSSGTSMAAPNAAGSAILLVEHYQNLFPGQSMRAAMLKGLIIHTADDMGTPGPNYAFGWGLMNTKAAADHIQNHYDEPDAFFMVEDTLTTATTMQSYAFTWDGSNAIRATLSWTDPPGPAQSELNVTNSVLVNDLDLRIVCPSGTTNYPYVLDLNNFTNAATFGDNTRDNIEQVYIADPNEADTYTAIVTHKGSLSGGEQHYALLLSGTAETQETVEYELTILSAHGAPLPPVGVYTNDYGTTLTNWIGDSPLAMNGTQYVGIGWTMNGHDPQSGTATQMVMTVTNEAVLTWQWATNYWLATAVSGDGGVDQDDAWIVSGSNITLFATASNGWSFAEWTGDVPAIQTNDNPLTLLMDQPRMVTAIFTANTYTVSFDSQDGSIPDPETKQVTFGEPYGALATTTREGYAFGGWWTEPDGGSRVTAGTEVTIASDHTLHARWISSRGFFLRIQ